MFVDDPYRTIRNLQKKLAILRAENDELSTKLTRALSMSFRQSSRGRFRVGSAPKTAPLIDSCN